MHESVIKSINICKLELSNIKSHLMSEINENMENGNFDVPISYQTILKATKNMEASFNSLMEVATREPSDDAIVEEETEEDEDVPIEEDVDNTDPVEESIDKEPEIVKPKATVIGGKAEEKEELPYYGLVPEIKKLPRSQFIFDSYKVQMTRGSELTRETAEIFLYIAPLSLEPGNHNVPIIAHAFSAGTHVEVSSYDVKDDGHSLVTVDINDYHILCRGQFDDDGVFSSFIVTCGISATNGDVMEIKDQMSGSKEKNPTNIGHLKFSLSETDIVEIFPLSLADDEYLVISISEEFLDYYVVALDYGMPRLRFYFEGNDREITAKWQQDIFSAELV